MQLVFAISRHYDDSVGGWDLDLIRHLGIVGWDIDVERS